MQVRRKWHDIVKVLKEKTKTKMANRILYPARLSFRTEREIKKKIS